MPTEEKKEEKQADEKPVEEEKKEPKPPSPCVLFVDLHCVGCAKKIEKSIMKMRGSILFCHSISLLLIFHMYTTHFHFVFNYISPN